MNQDATPGSEPRMDKGIGRGKVAEEVFIFHIVDLDGEMVE
jgi:hypothetical protein